jgi:lipoyl(octanoyl) transferase
MPDPTTRPIIVRYLGRRGYRETWDAMRAFTERRQPGSAAELWLLEHPPIFTQGQAGKPEHLLNPGDIPVLQSDRGGQVTYHGPGQLIVYLMVSLRELGLGIRRLVTILEQSVIDLLSAYDIVAVARPEAPGVYVADRKIASLGLRVRRGCTYHGLALNVDMELEPFSRINPCGHPGLAVTQLRDLGIHLSLQDAGIALIPHLCHRLGGRCIPGEGCIPSAARDTQAASNEPQDHGGQSR